MDTDRIPFEDPDSGAIESHLLPGVPSSLRVSSSKKGSMLTFKRIHDTGTDGVIRQSQNGWHIQINLREPNRTPSLITSYKAPTLELAKQLAHKELVKYGHACRASCRDWVEFLGASS